MTPEQRALRARIAAHESWARTSDPSARTQPARDRFEQRFLRQVDPTGELSEAERQRRAASARSAYFTRLAYRSAQARKRKAPAATDAPDTTTSFATNKGLSYDDKPHSA
jgi:hypothetical protein